MKTFKAIVIDVFKEDRLINRYSLNTESISMGRHSHCDVVLADPSISRRHALISYEKGQWIISNLGTNGTFYKGEKVDKHCVRINDEYQIGSFKLLVRKAVVDESDEINVLSNQETTIGEAKPKLN